MTNNLQQMLFDPRRLNEAWHVEFGRVLATDADGAEDRLQMPIERHYAADPRAVDAYSRVACFLMRQRKPEKALEWFAMDAKNGRQTWWQRLRHAECLAGAGRLTEALALAKTIYDLVPDAVNGYATIAWTLREQGHMAEALEWMRKDIEERRITPGFSLNAAVLFAETGAMDQACAMVENAYAKDPTSRDGFARLGNLRRARNEFQEALALYRRDVKANRLNPGSRLIFAELLARADLWAEADAEAQRAYAEDPTLRDGFARLGNLRHARHDFQEALALYRRDVEASRLNPGNRLVYAELLARADLWAEADAEAQRAYAEDPTLRDGFARLGHLRRVRNEFQEALALFRRDAEASRLNPGNRLIYAELLARADLWAEADAEAQRAYAEDLSLRDGFSCLAKWMSSDKLYSHLLELSKRDLRMNRQTALGSEMCSIAIRARASLDAELAALSEWMPPPLDIKGQWLVLEKMARVDHHPKAPVKILNAELHIADAQDALIQFRELVLQESYHFVCSTPVPTIIDGGANIGIAIAYFKWLYPEAHIVAFEPHPDLYELCRRNIACNGWKHVTLYPFAMLDNDGVVTFNILPRMPMGSSVTKRLIEALSDCNAYAVTVKCKRLGKYLSEPVDYLKLDIEGAETRVLRDLGDQMRQVQRGFIEYHYGAEDNALGELLAILERGGFQYRLTDPAASTAAMPVYGRRRNDRSPWSCSIYFHATNGGQ
jgi:FkbM family methyltransferase